MGKHEMFHLETTALYVRRISSLPLLFEESYLKNKKKPYLFRHPLFMLLIPQTRIIIPCLDNVISCTNIS